MKNLFNKIYNERVKKNLPILIFLIFSTLLILSFFEINRLNAEVSEKSKINEELSLNYSSLNSSFNSLESNFSAVSKNYNTLSSSYNNLLNTYDALQSDFGAFEEKFTLLENDYASFEDEIQTQLSYFQENSNIENLTEYSGIMNQLYGCFSQSDSSSYSVNLACIDFILTHESRGNNFGYKNDTRNELLSLKEFYDNKGGDCDDWARAFFAIYNHIKSLIQNPENSMKLILKAYEACASSETFWLTNENDWYINACTVIIENHEYVYPLCGIKDGEVYGHCFVAFTEHEINSISDINTELSHAIIVEPQSGEYISSYTQSLMQGYTYYILMTDNDLIMKTEKYNESSWKGYTDYYNEIVTKKENINQLLNSFN